MHRVCLIFGGLIVGLVIYDMVGGGRVREYHKSFFKKWDGCSKTIFNGCVDISPYCKEEECNTEDGQTLCKKTCQLCQDELPSQEYIDCISDFGGLNSSYMNDAGLIYQNRRKMYMSKTPNAEARGQAAYETNAKFI